MSDGTDQSFREQVEEIRNERNDNGGSDLQEESPSKTQWILLGAFFGGGFLGAVANPTQPVLGFFVGAFFIGVIVWAFVTEEGKEARKEFMNEMQQQQQQNSTSSEPKVICSNCGWKNPETNNYCHDCGEELDS